MKIITRFREILDREKSSLILYIPLLVCFGIIFYVKHEEAFRRENYKFLAIFFGAIIFTIINRYSFRSLIFSAIAAFLFGSFYANFYEKNFLNYTEITGKVFANSIGKVTQIKKFYNPITKQEGATILISSPIIYKAESYADKKISHKKKHKKKKKSGEKKKKIKKEKKENSEEKPKVKKSKSKKSQKKNQELINSRELQDIDRRFIDYKKHYQNIEWKKYKNYELFPNPPPAISVNIVKNFQGISINDVIAAKIFLNPIKRSDFPDDFDFRLDAKAKKIGAYGFVAGEVKIIKKSEISSSNQWFESLRENIRNKILTNIDGDTAQIAVALLIGDQTQISKKSVDAMRNSGLIHLLSISGFHLSLASLIFFASTRFILSRNEYLTLHFDIKKFAAIAAIFSSYFYLKISGEPLPAQRAFLMILFLLLSFLLSEKFDPRRIIMISMTIMILQNPFSIFNISFQLSFAAIIALATICKEISDALSSKIKSNFGKIFFYIFEIIFISIIIQIATTPFLMHSFQSLSLLGFVANILAIPLASFLIMPLGFLSLFLMIFNAQSYCLYAMKYSIILIQKIADFISNLDHSHFTTPSLPDYGLITAIIGLSLICFSKKEIRIFGTFIFAASFSFLFFAQKPNILFDGNQKFFAIYDKKNGLVFSKELKPSKQRIHWMEKMGEKNFKSLKTEKLDEVFCDEQSCFINKKQKFLVLIKRNKISEICKNDFDVIVNLTAKYALPNCIKPEKIKIDNMDFYEKGGQFFI